jgi:hypothetical protein
MSPILIIFDVTALPDGDLVIGGTDEYIDKQVVLSSDRFEGKRVSMLLRGGKRIESHVLGIVVHTALTEQRNVYLRIPPIVEPDSLRGAIVSVELDGAHAGAGGSAA